MRGNMLLNYLSYLYPELKNSSCQLSMLDVGCGSGAFLKVFQMLVGIQSATTPILPQLNGHAIFHR